MTRKATKSRVINMLSLSGGKDSTAMLLLALEKGVTSIKAVFADTGHEHPQTYEYIDYLEKFAGIDIVKVRADFSTQIAHKRDVVKTKWREDGVSESIIERALSVLRPTGVPMLDLCLWKGRFPGTRSRFCSIELKREPIISYQNAISRKARALISWQGVRRDESKQRESLLEKEVEFGSWETTTGLLIYRPILDWTADDVFSYHRKHGCKPNPLYSCGMGRVGCMPCIHSRKDEIYQISVRFPDEIDRVREWERIVSHASKRGSSTFFDGRLAAKLLGTEKEEIKAETHGIDVHVVWSKTAYGGKQMDIFKTADVATCSSLYGLCE